MSEPRKSRLIAGIVIVLVFFAGVVAGFFLHHGWLWRHGPPGFAVGGPPAPPPGVKDWMRELKLTPEQHVRIDSVLTRREADIRSLMSQTRPRFDSIAARTRSEIQVVLTPSQQEEFAKITRRFESRRGHLQGR
jgi:Spy/CpxP family protein refolding chaperone